MAEVKEEEEKKYMASVAESAGSASTGATEDQYSAGKYADLSTADFYDALRDDGMKWAEAFCERFPQVPVEDAWGWFANAIEFSGDYRRSRMVRDDARFLDFVDDVMWQRRFLRDLQSSETQNPSPSEASAGTPVEDEPLPSLPPSGVGREEVARIIDPLTFFHEDASGDMSGQIKLAEFERRGPVREALSKADAILALLSSPVLDKTASCTESATQRNPIALAPRQAVQVGWRDIASAPKDGRQVFLSLAPAEDPTTCCGFYRDGEWVCAPIFYRATARTKPPLTYREYVGQPTHWMPLPDPPPALSAAEDDARAHSHRDRSSSEPREEPLTATPDPLAGELLEALKEAIEFAASAAADTMTKRDVLKRARALIARSERQP